MVHNVLSVCLDSILILILKNAYNVIKDAKNVMDLMKIIAQNVKD